MNMYTALVRGSYLVKMLCSTEYPTDTYYRYMALWYHYLGGFGRCGLLLGLVGGSRMLIKSSRQLARGLN